MIRTCLGILAVAVLTMPSFAESNTAELPTRPNTMELQSAITPPAPPMPAAKPPVDDGPVVNLPGVVTMPKGVPMPDTSAQPPAPQKNEPPVVNAPGVVTMPKGAAAQQQPAQGDPPPPSTAPAMGNAPRPNAPPPLIARPGSGAPSPNRAAQAPQGGGMPQGNMPAVTMPGQAPPGGGTPGASSPDDAAQAPKKDPNLELTAVEVSKTGQPGTLDERLKPYKKILDKINAGDTYNIVNQEAKVAPYSKETQWTINSQYDAFVLPMDQTKEGAVRLDARVAMKSGGKQLNALRAEGEVPRGKVMAFRGLEGSNGSELLLFLRQKNDDKQGGGQGDQEDQTQEQPDHEGQQDNASPSDQQKQEQEKEAQEAKAKEDQEKKDKDASGQQKVAKQDKPKDVDKNAEEAKDGQNIEALLNSLEEQDQHEQQEARFNRKTIKLPSSGEWW